MMDIGKKVKELRHENNLTQQKMAQKIHIAQNTLSQIENNIANPSYDVLISISNLFQCSTDYLLGREDDFGNITIRNENPEPQISAEEKQLLENFRALPDDLKHRAKSYLQSLSDAARQERLTMFQK